MEGIIDVSQDLAKRIGALPADRILMVNPITGAVMYLELGDLVVGVSLNSKTAINADGDFSIDWQTDVVPGDTITYAQKHGNHIAGVIGEQDLGGGLYKPYTPNYTYTRDVDGNIDTVSFTEVFGNIIII